MLKAQVTRLRLAHASVQQISSGTASILEYKVRGRINQYNGFPLDMLRYDSSWPAYERELGLFAPTDPRSADKVTITLRGLECTPARWASFGWEVL